VPADVQAERLQVVELEYGPIRVWDVSAIQDYSCLFYTAAGGGQEQRLRRFNADISGWNVSGRHKDMHSMFLRCQDFNQPLNEWDMSGVDCTSSMFEGCYHFNQPLSKWDVRKVVSMQKMFSDARAFNQDIGPWKLETCRLFSQMFLGAEKFDQGLEKWARYLRNERKERIRLQDDAWFPDTIHTYQMLRGARKFHWSVEAYGGVFPRP